jgi:V/A-type H+-transporting ATPase subunit C
MKDGLIFANARAKAKELNLFTEERLHRMMEAKTLDDAVRVLIEVNYAGGMVVDSNSFYELLKEEERLVTSFVREVAPADVGFECFFMRNDYHNIKALLKAKYGKLDDIEQLILPDGNMSYAEIKDRFDAGKLDFNPYIIDAISTIEKSFETGNISPRIIDVEIDKAMYKEIDSILQKSDKYIKEYFITFIDSTNIATYIRTNKIRASFSFFESNFIEGGSIKVEQFKEYNMDTAKLIQGLSGTKYKEFLDQISTNEDMASYETAQDNYLLKIFASNKTDMFSVAPIVGYYLAKLNEIKVLRVVLVCIKNKVPFEEMKKRARELYA